MKSKIIVLTEPTAWNFTDETPDNLEAETVPFALCHLREWPKASQSPSGRSCEHRLFLRAWI